MRRYEDYKEDPRKVRWTMYNILVPTEEDKQEVMDAMQHFHDLVPDSENIVVNQMMHEYLEGHNIFVDASHFEDVDIPIIPHYDEDGGSLDIHLEKKVFIDWDDNETPITNDNVGSVEAAILKAVSEYMDQVKHLYSKINQIGTKNTLIDNGVKIRKELTPDEKKRKIKKKNSIMKRVEYLLSIDIQSLVE